MEKLESLDALLVRQKKEWGEILTGFETKNSYVVTDKSGHELYAAAEESGGFMATVVRLWLKALRPFTMNVVGLDGVPVIRATRPFRFYFHEVSVYDDQDRLLGTVKRRFTLLRRVYRVFDSSGAEIFQLFGPILHPWTFQIKDGAQELGKITKKWSGLGKEMFTDADNFGVQFPADWPSELKAIFLGAVFLIDFVHFENKDN